jgi:antitoxin component of MazEF toxin-antitoxin module
MEKAQVQDVNGMTVVALPASVLERLHLSVGSEVRLEVKDETLLIASPSLDAYRRLEALVAGSDPRAFERTAEDEEWLNAAPVGRELI